MSFCFEYIAQFLSVCLTVFIGGYATGSGYVKHRY